MCSTIWREKLRMGSFQEALVFLYQIVLLPLVFYVENKLDPNFIPRRKKKSHVDHRHNVEANF